MHDRRINQSSDKVEARYTKRRKNARLWAAIGLTESLACALAICFDLNNWLPMATTGLLQILSGMTFAIALVAWLMALYYYYKAGRTRTLLDSQYVAGFNYQRLNNYNHY